MNMFGRVVLTCYVLLYHMVVDGGWTEWNSWSSCDKTCGLGYQRRIRTCTNPSPTYNGRNCLSQEDSPRSLLGAVENQIKTCFVTSCAVDGGWSQWNSWTTCDKSCGLGYQRRQRTCTDPSPKHDGRQCLSQYDLKRNHLERMSRVCHLSSCPVDGGWSEWNSWTTCDKSCGLGYQRRQRTCTSPSPKHDGRNCLCRDGLVRSLMEKMSRTCQVSSCPVDGNWAVWNPWTTCDKSCGGGRRQRQRACTEPSPKHNGRQCLSQYGLSRSLMEKMSQTCNASPCAVDGGWSVWSAWSSCDQSCGGGKIQRRRTCTNPSPSRDGKRCLTQDNWTRSMAERMNQVCNLSPCPVVLEKLCPKEREDGICVLSDGTQRMTAIIKLDSLDGNTTERNANCLQKCSKVEGVTACQLVWGSPMEGGCYAYTSKVEEVDAQPNHSCWIYSKCNEEKNKCSKKIYEGLSTLHKSESPLVRNKLLAVIPKLCKQYVVHFSLLPTKYIRSWASIIHLIGTENGKQCDETHGVWFGYSWSFKQNRLSICTTMKGEDDHCTSSRNEYFSSKRWVDVEISQKLSGNGYTYSVHINGVVRMRMINGNAESLDEVLVYTAAPWWQIKNFQIKSCKESDSKSFLL